MTRVEFTLPIFIPYAFCINPVFILFHTLRVLLGLSTLELLELLSDLIGS
jgi:hypothetical protein